MNDCPNGDIRDLLPDLLHGRLDASERARVESHVATCAACSAELGLLRDLRTTMRRVPAIDASAIAAAIPAVSRPRAAPLDHVGARRRPSRRSRWVAPRSQWPIGSRERPPSWSSHRATSRMVNRRRPIAWRARRRLGLRARSHLGSQQLPRQLVRTCRRQVRPLRPARSWRWRADRSRDLSDRELDRLLDELETFDAVPSTEVEDALPVTPLEPAGETR